MFLDEIVKPFIRSKKAQRVLPQVLAVIILVLVLIGVVSYVIYSFMQGKLTPLQ